MRNLILVVAVTLFGCATTKAEKPVFVETKQTLPEPAMPSVVPVPVAMPVPGQLRPNPKMKIPTAEDQRKAKKKSRGKSTASLIKEANAKATSKPIDEGFFNAVQVYDYAVGVLFQVYTAPMRLTTIQMNAGERVMSVASGDTVRWIIGQTTAGEGAARREIVLIKPVRSGLHTNLIITTNQRIYQLEAHSFKTTYMASVSWNYPSAIAREMEATSDATAAAEQKIDVGGDVTSLNFSYHLVGDKDDLPSWSPVRVFDDGKKTYVQFPKDAKSRKMPALFLLSKSKEVQIVNYRVQGDYYVVDGLFDVAQLRLGEKSPVTLGIERTGGR